MVSNKRTTVPIRTQQSDLDWNGPQEPSTPRGEYGRLIDGYSPVWGIQPASNFGPIGGLAQ